MIAAKWKWLAGGAGVLGLLLWSTKKASASTGPVAKGQTATVIVPITAALPRGGIILRTEPSARGGRTGGASGFGTMIAPEGVPPNDSFTGDTVEVLETGIADADGKTGGEWWRVVSPSGGIGYARAVGPDGTKNLQLNAAPPAVAGSSELLHRIRTAQSRNLPHVAAQYHDHYINALIREGRVRA